MEEEAFEIGQFEIENRLRNLCWTVSGDYALNLKLDTLSYSKSVYVSLYLVKKLYCGAEEQPLTSLAQLCVDSAVYKKISKERPGILEIRKKAFEELMEYDFTRLAASFIGQIRLSLMQEAVLGPRTMQSRIRKAVDMLEKLWDTRIPWR